MSEQLKDREQFETDLPFFVNGTLIADKVAWMEARIAEHPSWNSEVEFARLTRDAVRSASSSVSAEERWNALQARLVEEGVLPPTVSAPAQPVRLQPQLGRKGWAAALLRPLQVPWLALLVAAAVVVFQGYLLAGRSTTGSEGAILYRSVSAPEGSCSKAKWLRVAVAPTLSVGEWSIALRTLGLSVAAGPAEGGEWTLRVPTEQDAEAKRHALRVIAGVEDVIVWTPPAGTCP